MTARVFKIVHPDSPEAEAVVKPVEFRLKKDGGGDICFEARQDGDWVGLCCPSRYYGDLYLAVLSDKELRSLPGLKFGRRKWVMR